MKEFKFDYKSSLCPYVFKSDSGMSVSFLENGSVFEAYHEDIMINLFRGDPLTSGDGNLYLRVMGADVQFFALTGPEALASFDEQGVTFKRVIDDLSVTCEFILADDISAWFWKVTVQNNGSEVVEADVVYAQDMGLAEKAGVLLNESYMSHYLGHTVLNDEDIGNVICSRRNLKQDGKFPWAMMGSLNGSDGYLTDGFQFYGVGFRGSRIPAAVAEREFPNKVQQYEYAMPTLKTAAKEIQPDGMLEEVFFLYIEEDHPDVSSESDLGKIATIRSAYGGGVERDVADDNKLPKTEFYRAKDFVSKDLSSEELAEMFPGSHRHEEREGSELLSFFYGKSDHVVLKAKELMVARAHGHIIKSGRNLIPNDEALSSTCWMNGVFNAQVTVGNTTCNRFISLSRNHLNVLRSGGQRLMVKSADGWQVLGVPSAYEIGLNHCRWFYRNDERSVDVTVWSDLDTDSITVDVNIDGDACELMLINNLTLGGCDHDSPIDAKWDGDAGVLGFVPDPDTAMVSKYPDASFSIRVPDADKVSEVSGDEGLFEDGKRRNSPVINIMTGPVNSMSFVITGDIIGKKSSAMPGGTFGETREAIEAYWGGLTGVPHFSNDNAGLSAVNEIMPWFAHNAMVHMTIPRGLEQYSAGAWGTRDVCQGPIELLLSMGRFDDMQNILRLIFMNQNIEDGGWPQWFMFDRFKEIRSDHAHGDVIFWPLKAICDYIECTNDILFLDEQVSWMGKNGDFTDETASMAEHVEALIGSIKDNFAGDTHLHSFGEGDWNDSLQPADQTMKKDMVSGWTVALCYQVLSRYRKVCERAGLESTEKVVADEAVAVQEDYRKLVLVDDTVAGFIWVHSEDDIEYLLHPRDSKTGVSYRLLPMIRGIISEIFTKEQALHHVELIKAHLFAADGARLMDCPPRYDGGKEHFFQRAESAACFGREVGLHYVHAHIRYTEAMAKMGLADEMYRALRVILPVDIENAVPNAIRRQSNAYFSSSDGDVSDRYDAADRYGELMEGKVKVAGGWRIYSSGPGMYLNQVVSNFAGFRRYFDSYVFDPVIPRELSGLKFDLSCDGKPLSFVYSCEDGVSGPKKVVVNGQEMEFERQVNPYRDGGAMIKRDELESMLNADSSSNLIEITL